MDRYAMMLPEERRVVIAEKLRLSREGVYLTLNELISAFVNGQSLDFSGNAYFGP